MDSRRSVSCFESDSSGEHEGPVSRRRRLWARRDNDRAEPNLGSSDSREPASKRMRSRRRQAGFGRGMSSGASETTQSRVATVVSSSFPHLPAFACLAVVSVIYAWPLIAHLTTSIPGTANDHDVATMVWNVGWVERALNGDGGLLHTHAVVIPFGADLRLHAYGLLQGLLAYPFTGWLGVVGAFNLVLVATLFLNGAVGYALVQREVQNSAAALTAAVCLMFGAPLLFFLKTGRPSFASIWIICGALLATASLLDRPRIWKGLALGLLLVAGLLTDFQIVFFTALWLALFGAYRLFRQGREILDRPRLIALAIAGALFTGSFLLLYYPALSSASSRGYPSPTLDDMAAYSFRYWDYVNPRVIPYAYGYDFLAAAVGAVVLFRRRRGYLFWLLGSVALLVLALGPYLQPTHVPLPFAAFDLWHPLRQFRTPGRLTMIALIGLAVTAGFVLAHLLRRVRLRPIAIGLVAFAIGARLVYALAHDPLPVQTYHDYKIYHQIAHSAGNFALLEVPFTVRSGLEIVGNGGDILEYYQHVHGKRLLNGMIARLPHSVFECYRSHPSLLFLGGEPSRATSRERDQDFRGVLRWSGARYVLLHRSLLSEVLARRIASFLQRQPQLEQVAVEHDLAVYRVKNALLPTVAEPACRGVDARLAGDRP